MKGYMKFFLTALFSFLYLTPSDNYSATRSRFYPIFAKRQAELFAELEDSSASACFRYTLLGGWGLQCLSPEPLVTSAAFCPLSTFCAAGVVYGFVKKDAINRELYIWNEMRRNPEVKFNVLQKYGFNSSDHSAEAVAREAFEFHEQRASRLKNSVSAVAISGAFCPGITWCMAPLWAAFLARDASYLVLRELALRNARSIAQN